MTPASTSSLSVRPGSDLTVRRLVRDNPSFRRLFVSTLIGNFSDPARAEELKNFAPVNETSGSRISAERARETILGNADFAARHLPAIDEWIRRQAARP